MLHRQEQLETRRKWSIGIWDRFSRLTGWRKSAFINTILVSIVLLVLVISHIFLWTKSGNPVGYHIIHSGRCAGNGVGRLNTLLHLMINILSTLVLASTNFFMQVLNAPSRSELDSAHEKGSWLDIGVPSPRNTFSVCRFKTIMWLLFFLSSVPIHLIFNSTIFSTDNRRSKFSYFVFDESVLTGGAVYDPGASLSVPYDYFMESDFHDYYNYSTNTWTNSTALNDMKNWYLNKAYQNQSLDVHTAVEDIHNGRWHKLDNSDCNALYNTTHCSGLRAYRSVALILRGSSGWNRSRVWDLPANESSFWDGYVPRDVNNSLWISHSSNYSRYSCNLVLRDSCTNFCSSAMGFDDSDSEMWNYSLFPKAKLATLVSIPPAPDFASSLVSVEYCMAEPLETICQIGLASTLLWVVSIWYSTHFVLFDAISYPSNAERPAANFNLLLSVSLKLVLCLVVITKLGTETSLVTLGDVIESFISHSPHYLLGSCLLHQNSSRSYKSDSGHSLVPGPIQWRTKGHRRWHAVPGRIWLSSYFIFAIGIALLIYFYSTPYPELRWQGSFGQDVENGTISFPNGFSPTFEQAILIANSPQLFLSFAYLAFNGLFTRLHMAKEWSAMSIRYKALRVTNPQGQQSSTYFLQLPYRYSVPLLITSALLHWVLSGCIYLLVMKGDYFDTYGSDGPFNSVMAVGHSMKSLFAMMILTIFLAFIPPVFGRISLPPNTVVVGSNSLAIAAACQVSPLVGQNQTRPEKTYHESTAQPQDDEIELRHLMAPSSSLLTRDDQASESRNDEEVWNDTLLRVSQSKIRWGVVKMPSSWEEQFNRRDITVEHISFGLPEDDVQQPIVGHWYG